MAKRKSTLSTVVAFMSEEAQQRVQAQAGSANLLPLESIRPDPEQPRRLLPAELAQAVAGGELSPEEALRRWLALAEQSPAQSALTHNVRELRRLAESIARHGLIQPITVQRVPPGAHPVPGVAYQVVTGERRYWAQVLLASEGRAIAEGAEQQDPRLVKGVVAPAGISVRAHQLIENLLREDIDAVEKAEGFVALRRELSAAVNPGSPRQVPWRVVEETLGLSKRYRIYVTSVLRLAPEARALISRQGLTERTVRPIVQKLIDFPELQQAALRQLVAWQQERNEDEGPGRPLTASVQLLVDTLVAKARQGAEGREDVNRGSPLVPAGGMNLTVAGLWRKAKGVLRLVERLEEPEWDALIDVLAQEEQHQMTVTDLRLLHHHLDVLLKAIHRRQFGD